MKVQIKFLLVEKDFSSFIHSWNYLYTLILISSRLYQRTPS
jgi:hypothetical protein